MVGFISLSQIKDSVLQEEYRKDYIRHGHHLATANLLDADIYQYLVDKKCALPHYDHVTNKRYTVEELEEMSIYEVMRDSDFKAKISW